MSKRGILRSLDLPHFILDLSPGRLLVGGMLLGLSLIILSGIVHVGMIDAVVVFRLKPIIGVSPDLSRRDLPLGYIQQLNYGPWFLLGMPLLLSSAAMAWTWWNRSCESADNNIPADASLETLSRWPIATLLGIALTLFFVGTNVQVEIRDYKNLGLGWVQARAIREAADRHQAIPGSEFRYFAEGGQLREVTDAQIAYIDQPRTGMYKDWQFWAFVVTVKAIGGLWQATIVYLSLLYMRAGVRLVKHIKATGLCLGSA